MTVRTDHGRRSLRDAPREPAVQAACAACDASDRPARPPRIIDGLRRRTNAARWGRDRFSPAWAHPFRHRHRLIHDTVAVTPVVGTVMILAISVIGIAAVLTWGIPNIQNTQEATELEIVVEQFQAFDQVAEQVMRGGAVGKASEARLSISSGTIRDDHGTLLIITITPDVDDFSNTDRFFIQGLDDGDPQTFTVHSVSNANVADMYVDLARANLTKETPIALPAAQFDALGDVNITLGDSVYAEPTRVRAWREVGGTDHVIMETWIFPTGSLLYERSGPLGITKVRLESSSVITETDTGRYMRTVPMATVERDAANEPTFAAIFPMLFTGSVDSRSGVSAAGAGSYPLLFSLQGNTLRANGVDALALQVKAVGDRGDLWMDHFQRHHNLTSLAPADDSVRLDAATDPFQVVIMESLIEVALEDPVQAFAD